MKRTLVKNHIKIKTKTKKDHEKQFLLLLKEKLDNRKTQY